MKSRLRRIPALFVALILAFGAFGALHVITATNASAATVTAVNGYGKMFKFKGSDGVYRWYFVGDFIFSGMMRGFCIEPMKSRATTDVVGLISDLPGISGETEKQVHHMANEAYYGYLKSDMTVQKVDTNAEGYRYAFAIWYKMGTNGVNRYNQAVNSGQLTSTDVAEIKKIWDRAKRHGDYKVVVTAPAVKVGKSAGGSASIKNANAYGAPVGTRIVASATNAKITSVSGVAGTKGRVTSNGYVAFRYTVTNTGPVTITIKVIQPNAYQSKISFPSSSAFQRLIGASSARSNTGKVSFEKRESAPNYSASYCSPKCDGTGVLKASVVNGGGKVLREVFYNQFNETRGQLYVAPGATKSIEFGVKDGERIFSKYCYANTEGGSCVTGWITNPGSYLVECPAWATAEITVGCNCENAWARSAYTAPAAPTTGARRDYTGRTVLSKDGVIVGSMVPVAVPHGTTVIDTITMKVEPGLTIEARFSVSDGTKLLVNDKVLTKVMVLEVAGSAVKYVEYKYSDDGKLSSSATKLATVESLLAS